MAAPVVAGGSFRFAAWLLEATTRGEPARVGIANGSSEAGDSGLPGSDATGGAITTGNRSPQGSQSAGGSDPLHDTVGGL